MIVARGLGQGDEEVLTLYGYGQGSDGGTGPPYTPLPYGQDYTDRVYRDDLERTARDDERIDR